MIVSNSLDLKKYTGSKTAAALGSFDALHKGHMSVIAATVDFAKKNGVLSLVQIFEKPLYDEKINSTEKKLSILESVGVDIVVIERFDEDFCKIDYKSFVADFLNERYHAVKVFAGENYRFGHLAEGDPVKLAEECKKYGIETHILPYVKNDDGIISSTIIRKLIREGNVKEAAELMSRPYEIEGTVVSGRGVGHTIGFPTANISLPNATVVPCDGVYLTRTILSGKEFYGITNVGAKPTLGDLSKNIETYILGAEEDLYGKNIKVEFLKRIRDTKKFDSIDELKRQLEEDKKIIPQ